MRNAVRNKWKEVEHRISQSISFKLNNPLLVSVGPVFIFCNKSHILEKDVEAKTVFGLKLALQEGGGIYNKNF